MDFSNVCRTCLTSDSLNPIFRDADDHQRYSTAVFMTTGVKVEIDDGLPQNMCSQCMMHLNNSIKFRKLCKDTEQELLCYKSKLYLLNPDVKPETSKQIESPEDTVPLDVFEVKPEAGDAAPSSDDENRPLKQLMDYTEIEQLQNFNNADKGSVYVAPVLVVRADPRAPYEPLHCGGAARVRCKLCRKELSIRSVDAHVARRHPGADPRKAKCDLCDAYVMRNKMNRHRTMMHGTGCFRCGYCKSEFDAKEILLEHVAACTAKKKKRKVSESSREIRECDICHKKMQKASLRLHKAVKHAGLGPVCEHCGKRFGNKFRLNEHYRAKHGYEKFKCSYCDFQSAASMAMRNHERRHRGEKPFVCESCGAKFHAAYLLAQHKQSHRTERLVKCSQCPARFKANNSLHMHKLTCHSTALYKCTMCARAYSCRHYAVKHLRHVHQYRGPVPRLQRVPPPPAPPTPPTPAAPLHHQ